jgi:hypothetical protein
LSKKGEGRKNGNVQIAAFKRVNNQKKNKKRGENSYDGGVSIK